jgi:hypothetical protein
MKKRTISPSAEGHRLEGRLVDEFDWYFLDGRKARIFRPGERIERGQRLGVHADEEVRAEAEGTIRSIQYDVWREQVILGIARASSFLLGGRHISVAEPKIA